MAKEQKNENSGYLYIIAIVAIVAIVGMVFMFSGNKVSYAPQGANYVYEDTQGDMAGQAITKATIKPINQEPLNACDGCYCAGDLTYACNTTVQCGNRGTCLTKDEVAIAKLF